MADNDVLIQVKVDSKDAQAAIELFGKEAVKSVKKAEEGVASFDDALSAVTKNPVVRFITGVVTAFYTLQKSLNAAAEEAKGLKQIDAAIRSTGELSKEARDDVLAFAEALKETTTIDDDLIKSLFVTAKSFGVTNDEAKKLTKAAIDLAAATGVDAETALRQLGGTLDGSIGKIGNLGEEFRNLSTTQLKAGDAIDLVNQKFGGSAKADLDSYQASINRLSNSWEDLLKAFGKTAEKSGIITGSLNYLTGVLNNVSDSMGQVSDDVALVRETFANTDKEVIGKFSANTKTAFEQVVKSSEGLGKSSEEVASFADRIEQLAPRIQKSFGLTGKALEEAEKKAKETAKAFEAFIKGVNDSTGTPVERLAKKTQEQLVELDKYSEKFGVKDVKRQKIISETKAEIIKSFNEEVARQIDDTYRREAEKFKEYNDFLNELTLGEQGDSAINKFAVTAQKQLLQVQKFLDQGIISEGEAYDLRLRLAEKFNKDVAKINEDARQADIASYTQYAAEAASTVLQGKEGAKKAVARGAGLLTEAFTNSKEAGAAVESLTGFLANGPEANKQFVKDFVDALPEVIQNVIESIPAVVEALVDSLILDGGIERIVVAFGKGIVSIFAAIGKQFGTETGRAVSYAFVAPIAQIGETLNAAFRNFVDLNKAIFQTFLDGIKNIFGGIISELASLPGKIADAIKKGLSGQGGGSGIINETVKRVSNSSVGKAVGSVVNPVKSAIGLYQGGIVPAYAADGMYVPRGTDTVPAMLTPGELVVPRDTTTELQKFLATQNAEINSGQASLISRVSNLLEKPVVVNSQVKVNQNAFADIILQLNRQNARLTA